MTVKKGIKMDSAPGEPTLHHIGFVVTSISKVIERFARSIAGQWDGAIIHDPIQAARVAFIRSSLPQQAMIELVEPSADNAPTLGFLKRGGGLHHLCYEVDNLDRQLTEMRSLGALITKQPAPAVAFEGRRIAWVYTAERLLLEYLERANGG